MVHFSELAARAVGGRVRKRLGPFELDFYLCFVGLAVGVDAWSASCWGRKLLHRGCAGGAA
jgi:hypothetical protein